VLNPHPSQGVIGGVGMVSRYLRFAWALPEMRLLIRRLRRVVDEVQPAVAVVAGEKALYAMERAATASLPIVYYLMANLGRRPWYVRRLFPRVDLLVGIAKETLHPATDYGPRRTEIVCNGLDVEEVAALARAPAPPLPGVDKPLRLLFPASLLATKGQGARAVLQPRARRNLAQRHSRAAGRLSRATGRTNHARPATACRSSATDNI
jgi:hypothetical protein